MNALKFNHKEQSIGKTSTLFKRAMTHIRIILPLLVLLTGLIITYLNWNVANKKRENELRSYFEYHARDVNDLIVQRVISYEQILRGARGLFNASDNVSRIQFHSFFNSLHIDKNYPGIQGVGFSLIIRSEQIKKHIKKIREEGFPEYKIWPEGSRETYTSIIYLEPFRDRNIRAFGYDMFSEPIRREAMENARDSNETVISRKVNLVQETSKEVQAGFLIYLPVYKNGTSYSTIQERRSNIIGWVFSPFRIGDFIEGLLGEHAADLHLEIYDSKNISNETKMYDPATQTTGMDQSLVIKKEIDLNGHEWTVLVKSTPQLESRLGFNSARIILIIGFSLSFLFSIIIWLFVNKRMQSIITNTERERAEENLVYSEKRYRRLFETAKDGILILDAETGKIVDVNPFLIDLLGYSKENIIEKEIWEIGFLKDIVANYDKFIELQQKKYVRYENLPLETSNGRKINVEFVSNVYLVDNQKVIQCNIRDITERKRAEESLRETNEYLENLFNYAKAPIIVWDTYLQITQFNNAFEKLTGYNINEVKGKKINLLFPENKIDLSLNLIKKTESGERWEAVEIEILRKDKNIRTLLWNSGNVLDKEGKEIVATIAQGYDITERKIAEDSVSLQKRIGDIFLTVTDDEIFSGVLAVILEVMQSPIGVFGFIDENGALVVPTMTRQSWDKCEIAEKTIIFEQDTWGDSSWPRAIREKRPNYSNKISYKTPLGHIVIHRHISIPILFNEEVIGLFQVANKEIDYSEADMQILRAIAGYIAPALSARLQHKKHEKEIHRLNNELEQRVIERTVKLEEINKDLESFSYSVSHDLRAPLRGIDGFANILLEDYSKKLNKEGQRLLNVIRDNTKKMSRLIDDLLSFSRIGNRELSKTEIEMKALANSVYYELTTEEERETISMSIKNIPNVKGDPSLIRQLWHNIISNSIKFTSKNENRMIEIGSKYENKKEAYFVRDNGVGFDMQYYEKLFGVFQRLHSDTEFSGTGVGLAIAKRIVEKHGGKIWVESEIHVGTTVYFNL